MYVCKRAVRSKTNKFTVYVNVLMCIQKLLYYILVCVLCPVHCVYTLHLSKFVFLLLTNHSPFITVFIVLSPLLSI